LIYGPASVLFDELLLTRKSRMPANERELRLNQVGRADQQVFEHALGFAVPHRLERYGPNALVLIDLPDVDSAHSFNVLDSSAAYSLLSMATLS
jgi:hypothetical protein